MGRKSSVALSVEEQRLKIIHEHQSAARRRISREIKTKKAAKRLPGEELYKKNMAVFLKVGIPGISYTDIAARIGETKTTVKKWFTEDTHVREQHEFVLANLKDGTLDLIDTYLIEAVETLAVLMRFGSEKYMKEAAVELLGMRGVARMTKAEVETTNRKRHEWEDQTQLLEEIRQLSPDQQEKAIDALEKLQLMLSGEEVPASEVDGDELDPITNRDEEEDDEVISD